MAKVLVTGGDGFLGKHVVDRLFEEGGYDVDHTKEVDLRSRKETMALYIVSNPEIVSL